MAVCPLMNARNVAESKQLIDARGLWCPEPVVLARQALLRTPPDGHIEILVTDPLAPLDLQALCARIGARFLADEPEPDDVRRISIQR